MLSKLAEWLAVFGDDERFARLHAGMKPGKFVKKLPRTHAF